MVRELQEQYQTNTRTSNTENYSTVDIPPGTIPKQTQGLEHLKYIVLLRDLYKLHENKHKD